MFILSGIWHGAAWTFLFWGIFHGFFLVIERLFFKKILDKSGAFPAMAITFFFTLMGWVLFRVETFSNSLDFYNALFSFNVSELGFSKHFWAVFVLALFIAILPGILPIEKNLNGIYENIKLNRFVLKTLATLILLSLCITEVEVSSFNPFIYFRF